MSEQTPETPAPEAPQEGTQEQPATETPAEQPPGEAPKEEPQQPEGEAWDPERAKEKIRKINSENKSLRERATQAEEKAKTADELQQQNTTLGSENLKLRVGYELGLPYNLAVRLQGSTRDEMVTDAQQLVELVAPTVKPAVGSARPVEALKPGATPSNDQSEDDVLYNSLFPTGR